MSRFDVWFQRLIMDAPWLARLIIAVFVAIVITLGIAFAGGVITYGMGVLLHAGAQAAM